MEGLKVLTDSVTEAESLAADCMKQALNWMFAIQKAKNRDSLAFASICSSTNN